MILTKILSNFTGAVPNTCAQDGNRCFPLVLAVHDGPTNYENCLHLSERVTYTFAYRSPRKKPVSTLLVSTSLKIST